MEGMRDRILVATFDCIKRLGLTDMSLSDICAAAGISRGALYVHFKSKSEILQALARRMSEITLEETNFQDAAGLRRFVRKYLKQIPRFQSVGMVELDLAGAARSDQDLRTVVLNATDARLAKTEECMERLRTSGFLKPGVEPKPAAHMLIQMLSGAFMMSTFSGQSAASRTAVAALVLDTILTT